MNAPRIPQKLMIIEDVLEWKNTIEEEELISEVIISGKDIAGEDFYKLDINASRFERSKFLNCDFEKSSFVDVIFDNCDFSNSRFTMAYFYRCEFRNCKCLGVIFNEAVMKHVKISESMLKYASLNGAKFEYVEMKLCDMTESSIAEITYKKWNADECLFIGTNFFHTKLMNFDFTTSELENIIISDTLEEIRGAKITAVQALEAARFLGMQVV